MILVRKNSGKTAATAPDVNNNKTAMRPKKLVADSRTTSFFHREPVCDNHETQKILPNNSQNDHINQLTKILGMVVLAFLFCWLPNNISQLEYHLSMSMIHYKQKASYGWLPWWHTGGCKNGKYLNGTSVCEEYRWHPNDYNEVRRDIHLVTIVLFYAHVFINPLIYQLYRVFKRGIFF